MCYQAVTIILIALVLVYFGMIGPEQFFNNVEENMWVLARVAVPTTIVGTIFYVFCLVVEERY